MIDVKIGAPNDPRRVRGRELAGMLIADRAFTNEGVYDAALLTEVVEEIAGDSIDMDTGLLAATIFSLQDMAAVLAHGWADAVSVRVDRLLESAISAKRRG